MEWSSNIEEWLTRYGVDFYDPTDNVRNVLNQTFLKPATGAGAIGRSVKGSDILDKDTRLYRIDLARDGHGDIQYTAAVYVYTDGTNGALTVDPQELAQAARALRIDATDALGSNWTDNFPREKDAFVYAGNVAGLLSRPDPKTGEIPRSSRAETPEPAEVSADTIEFWDEQQGRWVTENPETREFETEESSEAGAGESEATAETGGGESEGNGETSEGESEATAESSVGE